ncbi:MAG: hypothetical protein NTZ49_05885 [Candidatus Parcubacteria bacterium]|nr:hypothetical protein [Candidatus Parcubacteria bacterium]
MIIKYADNFESIFYAIICHNITGYFLVPKSQPQSLFEEEDYIDADKINKQQILNEHNQKFGLIKWLNINDKTTSDFKADIMLALRFWHAYKYKVITECIKYAIKYGLTYLPEFNEYKIFKNITKQVFGEINLAASHLELVPVQKNKDLFLIGDYNEESQIGDLVLKKIKEKYFGYNFLLRTPRGTYLLYKDKIISWDSKPLEAIIPLAKILESIYDKPLTEFIDANERKTVSFSFLSGQGLAFN